MRIGGREAYTDFNASLVRHVIPSPELPRPLSPGWIPATRLASSSINTFYAASSTSLHRLSLTHSAKRARLSAAAHPQSPKAISDDFIVPKRSGSFGIEVECLREHSVHREEIQAVYAGVDGRVATVDGYGAALVSGGSGGPYIVQPGIYESGESGWAGITFGHVGEMAIARYFYKDLSTFDGDIPKRTFHCRRYPTAVCAFKEKGGVIVAEGSELALYDGRVGERGGCCVRHSPGRGQLYALDVGSTGDVVGTAGADRTVHVYDSRTWSVRGRWTSCLKYECVGLTLSEEHGGFVYVCGIDNELACGAWSSTAAAALRPSPISKMMSGASVRTRRRAFGFRADSRIVGMTYQSSSPEVVAVLSESGAFYMLSVSSHQDKSMTKDEQDMTNVVCTNQLTA